MNLVNKDGGTVVIVASFGNATVKRTLYGPVTAERYSREKLDAKRRTEQLDTSKPDVPVKRREERYETEGYTMERGHWSTERPNYESRW